MDTEGGGRETYMVYFSRVLNSVAFLVEGCLARANTPGRLRKTIMYRHWKAQVVILQEGPSSFPQCPNCGIHISSADLIWHQRTDRRNRATDKRLQRRDVEMAQKEGDIRFSMYYR